MLPSEYPHHDGHERFIRHGIEHCADNGAGIVSPRYPSVDEIGDAGVDEEREGVGIRVMEEEVADEWGAEEACTC